MILNDMNYYSLNINTLYEFYNDPLRVQPQISVLD